MYENRRKKLIYGSWLVAMALLVIVAGCGQQFGAILYHLGAGQNKKVEAEFQFPVTPLLILVDDDWDLVRPRTACDLLVDLLANELRQRGLAERVTSNDELAKLRLAHANFDERGAREIGQLAQADTILWLQIKRFALPDDLDRVMTPVPFALTVKVLDANAEKRDEVRLWPKTREGHTVEIEVSPYDLRQCKDMRQAHELMATQMAGDIAKLFYTHRTEPGT